MINDRFNPKTLVALLAILVAGIGCDAPPADQSADMSVDSSICDADDGAISLPDGFCAVVVADTLGTLRHIDVRDNGDVYAIHRQLTDEGGITALRDTDDDGKADVMSTFGDVAGTGLLIHDGYLYASTDTSVYRFMLSDELVPANEPELVVGGFPDQGSHAAKSITIDGAGNLYVNVGGPSNACQEQARTP
ncbi:MAG: hypothetical protein WD205_01940, partial [Rhodothermales bacterium]